MSARSSSPRRALAALWLFAAACPGCNDIFTIEPGALRECKTADDCAAAVPACVTSSACVAGRCAFEYTVDGQPLADQKSGDCAEIVCDGAGSTRLIPDPSDVVDDGLPCTLDACENANPVHRPLAVIPCYTGSPETKGKGICVEGIQKCKDGLPSGACEGEVLPGTESCLSILDEDCDGLVNEEGEGCSCVPSETTKCYSGPASSQGIGACHAGTQACNADGLGYGPCIDEQTPAAETCFGGLTDEDCDGAINEEGGGCVCGDTFLSAGEECDDGNTDDLDACTSLCTLATCGDGFIQVANGELCDDGNLDSIDACNASCAPSGCGDGYLQPSESCDDGNTTDGDGCSSKCVDLAVDVSAGGGHTCALFESGRVKCWGSNSYGQLGLGDTKTRGDETGEMGSNLPVVDLGAGVKAAQISAGGVHTCARLTDGHVKCWGSGFFGVLGLGDEANRGDAPGEMGDALPIVDLGAGDEAIRVTCGGAHTCVVLKGGAVKCWGSGSNGALGLGDEQKRGDGPGEMGDALPPVDFGATPPAAIDVEAGGGHSCALFDDGRMKCWGSFIGLGLGDAESRGDNLGEMGDALPYVDLGTNRTAIRIATGGSHTCAIRDDNSLMCWGVNYYGECGLADGMTFTRGIYPGQMGDAFPPVDLGTNRSATQIDLGDGSTCARLDDGHTKCWGSNDAGKLGRGNPIEWGFDPGTMGDNLSFIDLGQGASVTSVTMSDYHACGLLEGGHVKCWGGGFTGALGLGNIDALGDEPGEMGDNLPEVNLW